MPLSPGDILFTSFFTDTDAAGTAGVSPVVANDMFSFVATTNIAPGQEIIFWDTDGSAEIRFTFTVGANGLGPLDRVTIATDASSAANNTDAGMQANYAILSDPSRASIDNTALSDISTDGTLFSFTLSDDTALIASDEAGTAIAAIIPDPVSGTGGISWADYQADVTNLQATTAGVDGLTLSLTALNAAIGAGGISPLFTGVSGADNVMFNGTSLAGYNDPSNWVGTSSSVAYANPELGGLIAHATQDTQITCFAAGTGIATPEGEVAVEALQIGDLVTTADGRAVPVKWLGRQTVMKAFAGEKAQLVRIGAGALGNHSDLYVTGDHGMVLEGVIVNASALVNGHSIDVVPLAETPEMQVVYHVETEAHDVILASGAPSETYLDVPGRRAFDNYAEYLDLYGAEAPIAEARMPRITSARLLPAQLRARRVA